MSVVLLLVLAMCALLGSELILRAPPTVHTPLLAALTAMAGVTLMASLIILGESQSRVTFSLGFIAVVLATTSGVGALALAARLMGLHRPEERG